MSEQQSPNQQALTIKQKQESQRKFGCPCGKWYLSYPALFTHVKQKHEGKPPGPLIKPKTDKARGRPRLPTNNAEQDQSILNYDCQDQLDKVLFKKDIVYNQPFEKSDGHQTCQDMATEFLKLIPSEGPQKKILTCFINYIKFFIGRKYDNNYWQTHKPSDIIDISNQLVRNLQMHKQAYPMDKQTLVWMYKNKWTDHKLVRRSDQQREAGKQNQKVQKV